MLQNSKSKVYDETQLGLLSQSFINRLDLMTAYVENVSRKKDIDKKYWVRSTGSDPHHNGQHALFLVNRQNQEGYEKDSRKQAGKIDKVYKPHDLAADNAIVGKDGILAKLNDMLNTDETILGGEKPFATMSIDASSHMEEFVIKKDKMTQEEAKKYFFRAGMLKVITDAMAVIDLHKDNIMPVSGNMPLIIDAEVDFWKYGDSGLESDALKEDEYEGRVTSSSFEVQGETKRSGGLFKCKELIYYKEFKNGVKFILEKLCDKKIDVANLYREKLENVGRIRVIPIKTADLAKYLHGYILEQNQNNVDWIKKEIINNISTSRSKKLEDGFIFDKINNLKVSMYNNDGALKNAVEIELRNSTIIAMYMDVNGKIYLGDTEVGEIVGLNGGSIDKQKIIGVMKSEILDRIDSMISELDKNK